MERNLWGFMIVKLLVLMSSKYDDYFGVSNSYICFSEGYAGRCGRDCPVFQMRECQEQDSFEDDFILDLVNLIKKEQPLSPLLFEGNEIFKSKLLINECNNFHEDLLLDLKEDGSELNKLFYNYYNKAFNLK